ncbi:MAG TPA: DUF72 domain-containing protein [Candidatus Dormibacteraeota bacterium]
MLWVGTSGWQYRHWDGNFYPAELAQREWLDFYASRFRVVEVNNTFYHLPKAPTFEKWRAETPSDFVVAVKMSRYLTHLKRLLDPEEPVQRFMERALRLRPKLGPVLVQLPPRFEAQPQRLEATLTCFPRGVRVAVEFRDDSWYRDDVRAMLERFEAALVLADSPRRRQPMWRTADWGFVRFHEGRASPHPCYGERALTTWAERIAELWPATADVYTFFNNDPRGCAVRDAVVFARIAERAGLHPTRVPELEEARLR